MSLKSNSPFGSWMSMHYPFSKDKGLRQIHDRFGGGELRIGKILEIIDALTADVSYKYISNTEKESETVIVTMVVDNISFKKPLSSHHDLRLSVILNKMFKHYSVTLSAMETQLYQ
jgi:hypothetical protein